MMPTLFVATMLLFLVTPGAIGAPPGRCICSMEYGPVCGVDRKTYGNRCLLRCAGVRLRYNGECRY